jgi:hypothetical protein
MQKAGTYTTYNRVRLALFERSYAHYAIVHYLKTKYQKIDERLTSQELHRKYFNKHALPEISRLSRVLNFNYSPLWKAIILSKYQALGKKIAEEEKTNIFLSIERELIQLTIAKQNKSVIRNPDYESELALLSTAIERAVGNALKDIEDDFSFERKSEELKRKYIYWYYRIAYRYKLPTLRIVPFVLRLITK